MEAAELINLSFYRFFELGDPLAQRALLKSAISDLKLRGTILLAHEGVNAAVSGTASSITRFKTIATELFGVQNSDYKESKVLEHSFNRLLIKIKKEIITVGDPDVRPDRLTANYIQPAEFKKWLDEKRPLLLLDARNQYEVELGTFHGAQHLKLDSSREFSNRAAHLVEKGLRQPVVTFCTGGIRCEKASAVLLKLGLKEVYQLEGGILRYLEEQGSEHFQGNCFVFDWRMAVDANLRPVARSKDDRDRFGRHRKPIL